MEARGRLLYLATLTLESFGTLPRFLIAYIPLVILLVLLTSPYLVISVVTADPNTMDASDAYFNVITAGALIGSLVAAVFPLVNSLRSLDSRPSDTRFTRFSLGARPLSVEERERVGQALEEIVAVAPVGTKGPTAIYGLDGPEENAYVIGTALFLTRPTILSPWLAAVVAHELAHLNSLDGRLTLALRRLVLPPVYVLGRAVGRTLGRVVPSATYFLGAVGGPVIGLSAGCFFSLVALCFALAGGGIGLFVLRPLWLYYWQQREYVADAFAAACGQGPGLVEFLRRAQFFDAAVPYLLTTHPSTELRIDRLLYPELYES